MKTDAQRGARSAKPARSAERGTRSAKPARNKSLKMWAEEVVAGRIQVLEKQLDWLDRKPEPEAIHQVRVATRRLRAALRHLGPCLKPGPARKLRRESGRLARALGEMRDLDILVQNVTPQATEARSPLVKLLKSLDKRRAARLHHATPEARMLRQHLPDYRRKLMS